ncbi:hypothetical protein DFH11DRAFT_1229687 [Phellopilus nigrolimitatus]|nr:hypothetical protein DFH11DRAFT_1229687 [Phellopilus nigrolimitatus]
MSAAHSFLMTLAERSTEAYNSFVPRRQKASPTHKGLKPLRLCEALASKSPELSRSTTSKSSTPTVDFGLGFRSPRTPSSPNTPATHGTPTTTSALSSVSPSRHALPLPPFPFETDQSGQQQLCVFNKNEDAGSAFSDSKRATETEDADTTTQSEDDQATADILARLRDSFSVGNETLSDVSDTLDTDDWEADVMSAVATFTREKAGAFNGALDAWPDAFGETSSENKVLEACWNDVRLMEELDRSMSAEIVDGEWNIKHLDSISGGTSVPDSGPRPAQSTLPFSEPLRSTRSPSQEHLLPNTGDETEGALNCINVDTDLLSLMELVAGLYSTTTLEEPIGLSSARVEEGSASIRSSAMDPESGLKSTTLAPSLAPLSLRHKPIHGLPAHRSAPTPRSILKGKTLATSSAVLPKKSVAISAAAPTVILLRPRRHSQGSSMDAPGSKLKDDSSPVCASLAISVPKRIIARQPPNLAPRPSASLRSNLVPHTPRVFSNFASTPVSDLSRKPLDTLNLASVMNISATPAISLPVRASMNTRRHVRTSSRSEQENAPSILRYEPTGRVSLNITKRTSSIAPSSKSTRI